MANDLQSLTAVMNKLCFQRGGLVTTMYASG